MLTVTPKSRLGLIKNKKPCDLMVDEVPEVEAVSLSTGTNSNVSDGSAEASSTNFQDDYEDMGEQLFNARSDPYEDVRDSMEHLSARDKAMYAMHTKETPSGHDCHVIPAVGLFSTYRVVLVLTIVGRLRDMLASFFGGRYVSKKSDRPSEDRKFFAPLLDSWENFFTRRMYHRIQDCFNRPVASSPAAKIDVLERVSYDGRKSMEILGSLDSLENDEQTRQYKEGKHFVEVDGGRVARRCFNLGSYNYLGFADDWDVTCRKDVMESLESFSISSAACRTEFGTTTLHRELEQTVSEFLGKEDSMVFTMGYNTNATTIPALVGQGDLILSDELNHTSIVNGARGSGADIRVFRHNSAEHLEQTLREVVIGGRPRTRRPWGKILVIVEGVYSMEGEYCDLRSIVDVCKKYGAYVYLDEAHSIGAIGPTGRGISEYAGVSTADIDIMMGTFTKSFGGMGGYISASKEVISLIRKRCAGSFCHNALSPVVCQQVLTCFKVIMGLDGTDVGKQKIEALRDNSNYMRMKLNEMGLKVLGHYDSPIMPVMLYNLAKMAAFSRECFRRGLAVVVVGFPAVPLSMCRARFCISAGHTRQDLDIVLKTLEEITEFIGVKYGLELK